ncbi:beta-lactoglobulin isoform X2 [Myotis myotis]|uniref:beta-lactoglobulin isoform X2 n=1 Tax=Myotis myotis TaxID=51298 RepID=UPI00174B3D4D|nr:beta-lactoglobulin isoform X2 [Myotis myotis]
MAPGPAGRPGGTSGSWRSDMKTGPWLPGRAALWAPVVLALGLGLASAQRTLEEVPVQPGFDVQKVAGRWLTLRLASSRAHLVSPDDPLRLALRSIKMRDGDLEFVLFWTAETMCRGVHVTIHPTGLPGQYRGSFEGGARMHVRFVSTSSDYSSLILYVRVEESGDGGDGGEVTSLWALLARRLPGDPQWLRRYLGYVREFQLQEAPVFNLEAQCPPPEAYIRPLP